MAFFATELNQGWIAARACEIVEGGKELTTGTSIPTLGPKSPWIKGVVPGTILTTLVYNDIIPDPLYGFNNENIPDIGDVGREHYTFWFYNNFEIIPRAKSNKVWLQFRGINYQAEVFVNGHGKLLSKGMFLRHMIDITNWIHPCGETNRLAVLIHPVDHPGHIPSEGGQGGDHNIAKDVAAQYVEGWDWIVAMRDRNTGIWDKVTIFQTGPVRLVDPHLVSTFLNSSYTKAQLWTTVELLNTAPTRVKVTISLNATLEGESNSNKSISTKEFVEVDANTTLQYSLFPILVEKPALWWPNGMGDHPLYKVDITIEVDGYDNISDIWTHMFGFRHINSYIDNNTNGRKFEVNGEAIFIRGGNYIVSDALLRLSEERYNTEVVFHAAMNLNMIRIWGGGLAERPEFYHACDRYGMLVWQEFWITGDCNGRGMPPSNPDWPLDHKLWLTCAFDTVKLLRNHASLALWCGGNECHPADDLNETLTKALVITPILENPSQSLDGTRLYIQGSLWSGIAAGNGEFQDGPYKIQKPEKFFEEFYYPYAFNPEIGNVGVPNATTIRATMQVDAWDPPKFLNGEQPNSTWFYHKFMPYDNTSMLIPNLIMAFGTYDTLDDFCEKAQLANYHQYRALIEGWNTWMWTHYTGVLIWKTQNPWPGLRGQMYDHLLDQTGAYFGVRYACEPIHIQLNLSTYNIEVVNTTRNILENATIEAIAYDVDGKIVWKHTFTGVTSKPKTTMIIGNNKFPIPLFKSINGQPVYFLLLKVLEWSPQTSKGFQMVSRNFYWLHPINGNYKQLAGPFRFQKIDVTTKVIATITGNHYHFKVKVKNDRPDLTNKNGGNVVAFAMRFGVRDEIGKDKEIDKRILPVFYSDNWFSLAPNESTTIDISFIVPEKNFWPELYLSGWNVAERKMLYSR